MEIILEERDHVRITAACLSSYAGHYGTVVYVGYVVEVAFDDGAIIPFLPSEVEPADLRWVYAE